jgi:hypothetical protein
MPKQTDLIERCKRIAGTISDYSFGGICKHRCLWLGIVGSGNTGDNNLAGWEKVPNGCRKAIELLTVNEVYRIARW